MKVRVLGSLMTQLISECLRTVPYPAAQTSRPNGRSSTYTSSRMGCRSRLGSLDNEARLRAGIKIGRTNILEAAPPRAPDDTVAPVLV